MKKKKHMVILLIIAITCISIAYATISKVTTKKIMQNDAFQTFLFW